MDLSKAMVISPEKCSGCRTCELICSYNKAGEFDPQKSAVTVIAYDEAMIAVPVMCTNCDEAACAKVCPTGAIAMDENDAMAIDSKKCIVCKMCISACPLGNVSYSKGLKKVIKCDLCKGVTLCARHCPTGAIEYKDVSPAGIARKKAIADKFSEVFGEGE